MSLKIEILAEDVDYRCYRSAACLCPWVPGLCYHASRLEESVEKYGTTVMEVKMGRNVMGGSVIVVNRKKKD